MNTENTNGAAVGAAVTEGAPAARPLRPSLRFFHANAKGTGCAIKMVLHPAHDIVDGSVWLTAAQQMTIGNRLGPNPTFPRFDWENAICIKLEFADLCKMLQVFRGECESLENGKGLVHRTAWATTQIGLRHIVDPVQGYSLELYRTRSQGEEAHAHILFYPWEALGIAEAIAGSMSVISFGIPMVIPHDTSEYKAKNREMRHANVRSSAA